MAATRETVPTWIVADRQTAGRGRRGRAWRSPVGNLMTTLYLPIGFDAVKAGQLAFVAGLALERTVRAFIGSHATVSLKWPNDVLVDGKKASGILLESAMRNNKIDWVAIGLGLNLAHHPDDTPYPATSLAVYTDVPPGNLAALQILAQAFDDVLRQWRNGGFGPVLKTWRAVAHGLGGPIVARLENETFEGIFTGIDDKGALLLQTETGDIQTIDAGDIFFPDRD